MAILVRLIVFGAIAFVAYRMLFPSSPIVVTLTSDGVGECKGISEAQKKQALDFAQEQLLEGETIVVKGYIETHGRVRWVFPKNTNQALAQRFRNFMAS